MTSGLQLGRATEALDTDIKFKGVPKISANNIHAIVMSYFLKIYKINAQKSSMNKISAF